MRHLPPIAFYKAFKNLGWKVKSFNQESWVFTKGRKSIRVFQSSMNPLWSKNQEHIIEEVKQFYKIKYLSEAINLIEDKSNPFTSSRFQVLSILIKEKTYLSKNLDVLAWCVKEYLEIHKSVGFQEVYSDHKSPRSDLESMISKLGLKYYLIIKDAWASFSMEESESSVLNSKRIPYASMKNLTMDDYVTWRRHSKYAFKYTYPHKLSVLDKCLVSGLLNYRWNKEGFLVSLGPNGSDINNFFMGEGFSPPKFFLKKCTWLSVPELISARAKYKVSEKRQKIQLKKTRDQIYKKIDKTDKNESLYKMTSLTDSSPLLSMPSNAHISYLLGAQEVCSHIRRSPHSSPADKARVKDLIPLIESLISKRS